MSLSIKPLIRKNAIAKDGSVNIYLRVIINRNTKFKATEFKIKATNWNPKNNTVKASETLAATINLSLDAIIQRMRKAAYDLMYNNEPVTHQPIFNAIIFADNTKFIDYALHEIKQKIVSKDRANHLTATANAINDFKPNILIAELTPQFLLSFKKKLSTNKLAHNTIVATMSRVRVFVKAAIRDKFLKNNPFDFVEVGSFRSTTNFLNSEELSSIIANMNKIKDANDKEVLRRFLFCCCAAFRYGDAERLDYSMLRKCGRGYYFKIDQRKTGEQNIVPLSKMAESFIDVSKTSGLVFKSFTNQFANRSLKTILPVVGVDRRVTTHIARHTFVTVSQEKGMSMKLAGMIAGHRKESTTNIYSHFDLNALFDGIDKWNN